MSTHIEPDPTRTDNRSWAARVAACNQERTAQCALTTSMFSLMAALGAWTAVLLPGHGDIRFSPLFWLLALLPMIWMGALGAGARWAYRLILAVLILAPCLCVAALAAAPAVYAGNVLDDAGPPLATPTAMLVILAISLALSTAGVIALRHSSLPGGAKPARFVAPGTLPSGRYEVPPAARRALRVGSLAMSGALVNAMFFFIALSVSGLVATDEPGLGVALASGWPAALAFLPVVVGMVWLIRGGYRLARCAPGAVDDLRRGWWLGMVCAPALLLLLWAWPVVIDLKIGLTVFMLPLAGAALWGGRRAMRRLPEAMQGI